MNLRIAVPTKGRLAEPSADLLRRAGIRFERSDRALSVTARSAPVELLFVRSDDVAELVADGVAALGITGFDLLGESGFDLDDVMPLGFGRCSLTVAVPEDSPINEAKGLAGKRVRHVSPANSHRLLRCARRRDRDRRHARLRRGGDETRCCRRHRRPGVDRKHNARQRPATDRAGAGFRSGPRRSCRSRPRRDRSDGHHHGPSGRRGPLQALRPHERPATSSPASRRSFPASRHRAWSPSPTMAWLRCTRSSRPTACGRCCPNSRTPVPRESSSCPLSRSSHDDASSQTLRPR